jgi:hypothetical protein
MEQAHAGHLHPDGSGETTHEQMDNTLRIDGYSSSEPITPDPYSEIGDASATIARANPQDDESSVVEYGRETIGCFKTASDSHDGLESRPQDHGTTRRRHWM